MKKKIHLLYTALCLWMLATAGTVSSDGTDDVSYTAPWTGAVARSQADRNQERMHAKDFGVKCDGMTDDTAALAKALGYARSHLPLTMYLPRGTCLYSTLGNLAYSGLTIAGESHRETILKFTGKGSAILIDAFASASRNASFVQAMNIRNLTVQANANTTAVLNVQGLARSNWSNIFVREANSTSGIAFDFKGVMLSHFENIGSSTDIDTKMVNVPHTGLRLTTGNRAGMNVGNSSNNTFTNAYFEGLTVGIQLESADQNTFISGSSESNRAYDAVISPSSRYNTFIGTGFESITATANVLDNGVYSKFINCYANKKVSMAGRGGEINGGYYQRIEVRPTGVKNRVHDVTLKHWESSFPGTGGYVNVGTASEWKNLYDDVAGVYIYPLAARAVIPVGASPAKFTNTTGQYVEVLIQTGTVSQVRIIRKNDSWLNSTATPDKHLLAPSDSIEVSYSGKPPQMSYVPQSGL